MVLLEAGKLPEGRYLGLWKLAELRGIEERADAVVMGALTTYTDVLRHAVLQRDFPLLCRAAEETGGVATQNRGTIGGNIANASPAADTPPALLVYDAELELVSPRGTRRIGYDRFHLGYKKMDLAPDELIARIMLPKRAARWAQYYRKVGTRRAQAISKVCLAATVWTSIDPPASCATSGSRSAASRPCRFARRRRKPRCAVSHSTGRRSPTPSRRSPATSRRSTTCDRRRGIVCTSRRAFSPSAWRPSDQLRVPRA